MSLLMTAGMVFSACCSGEEEVLVQQPPTTQQPPTVQPPATAFDDATATNSPDVVSTVTMPNPTVAPDQYEGENVMRVHMGGIQIPGTTDWVRLYGNNGYGNSSESHRQNVWVDIDGQPKSVVVVNNADNNDGSIVAQTDIVFLVDNSGSMSEEADAIANEIISWSQKLAQSGLDMKFGCVGYDGYITGGVNMTDVESLHTFLTRSGYTGTRRTVGWAGSDATVLQQKSSAYNLISMEECGTAALRFADDNYNFRSGASRIFINFTDEPNSPYNKEGFSVAWVENQENWPASKGVIHSVISEPYLQNYTWNDYYEDPTRMSTATGGTIIYTTRDFSDASLETLPVTGSLQNTITIYFGNIDAYKDGQVHNLTITIKTEDGKVQDQKTIPVIFE